MPRMDLDRIAPTNRTGYPTPCAAAVEGRWFRRLAPAGGLTQMGASQMVLKPGGWSSQRHWHRGEDELVVMLSGEAVRVDDAGETVLRAGDCCAFPAGDGNGHHLKNRSDANCVFVAISAAPRMGGGYPDIDMRFTADDRYVHKDGRDYASDRA